LQLIVDLLINALAIMLAAYLLPGVHVEGLEGALIAAVVLALINMFIKPIFVLITLPITILTLGLFILVINTLVILLVSYLVPGFEVDGFLTALLFSILLWIVNVVLHQLESRLLRPA